MTLTGASLFTCGGGSDIGMQMAGINVRWGIEKEAERAAWAIRNLGHPVTPLPIEETDPRHYEAVDVLCASPPCQGDSKARRTTLSDRTDRHIGLQTIRFVEAHYPLYVFLENVVEYQNNPTYIETITRLQQMGYWTRSDVVNAAEWGVPQSRRRLVMRASRKHMLNPLAPTGPRISWYDAIEDLLPGLPDDQLAPWQVRRLKQVTGDMLIDDQRDANGVNTRNRNEPAMTVTVGNKRPWRALLLANGGYNGGVQTSCDDQPAMTVTKSCNLSWRVLLESAIVKRLSTRCLARIQSFPNWYVLPEKITLACEILGEAVPPLLMQRLIEQTVSQNLLKAA